MNLLDIVNRTPAPIPWEEGDNIPWDDHDFSKRMLAEHLSQSHDMASRRFEKIDAHVTWIHNEVLGAQPTRILDLGCGPGLYTSRLARLGHECVGIDFSPASIAYAKEQAANHHLNCTYVHDDLRAADYGSEFGLVMMLFGEFNVFSALDARAIVRKASQALACDGTFLIEPHTFGAVQGIGQSGRSWYSSKSGLFSDKPHFCLTENTWDDASHTATRRYFIIDAATRQVTPYAQTFQAYTTTDFETMLAGRGLEEVELFPSLTGVKDPSQNGFFAITAREATHERER
jgi:SAM-dependent methyltransferase